MRPVLVQKSICDITGFMAGVMGVQSVCAMHPFAPGGAFEPLQDVGTLFAPQM
jgi:hypothetical protein